MYVCVCVCMCCDVMFGVVVAPPIPPLWSAVKVTSEDEPRKFFIHLLLQARVPLWAFSLPQKEDDMR